MFKRQYCTCSAKCSNSNCKKTIWEEWTTEEGQFCECERFCEEKVCGRIKAGKDVVKDKDVHCDCTIRNLVHGQNLTDYFGDIAYFCNEWSAQRLLSSKRPKPKPKPAAESTVRPAVDSTVKPVVESTVKKKVVRNDKTCCGIIFPGGNNYRRHFNTHHVKDREKVLCEFCKEVFASKDSLKNHVGRIYSTPNSKPTTSDTV